MPPLRIGIVDLVPKGPPRTLWARFMHPNMASIMPQVVGCWWEAEGPDVPLVCYTGLGNLVDELPHDVDLVFIGAFSQAALLAYSLSNLFRSRGAVTVLGGPHGTAHGCAAGDRRGRREGDASARDGAVGGAEGHRLLARLGGQAAAVALAERGDPAFEPLRRDVDPAGFWRGLFRVGWTVPRRLAAHASQ